MIRLAFLAVLAIGGLIAFGAFFLARGAGGNDVPVAQTVSEQDTPVVTTAPEAPDQTPLYFLTDVDLTQGTITVVLRDAVTDQGDLVVTDRDAIIAAQDTAFFNTTPSGGEVAGMVLMAMMGVPPETSVVQIYRDDALIAAVDCTSTTCGDMSTPPDMDLGPLLAASKPLVRAQSFADNYDDYLADLAAINGSPDYMFLDLQGDNATPQDRQTAKIELYLPTLVTPAGASVDPSITSALVRSVLEPSLPDGATVSGVTFEGTGKGLVADMDSGTPILAGGAQIPFPDVEFTNLRISIDGTAALSETVLQSLADQMPTPTDYSDSFAAFVRDRLQNPCGDCFRVKVNGDHYTQTTVTLSEPEAYRLDYYDLRDPP